jgi:hypothetical protein
VVEAVGGTDALGAVDPFQGRVHGALGVLRRVAAGRRLMEEDDHRLSWPVHGGRGQDRRENGEGDDERGDAKDAETQGFLSRVTAR